MKGLIVDVYKNSGRDCSNGGISGKVDSVVLVGPGIPLLFEANAERPAVRMLMRTDSGYMLAEPVTGKQENSIGWMDGGTFIYSNDSRFPSDYPIPLHDRQETPEECDSFSK